MLDSDYLYQSSNETEIKYRTDDSSLFKMMFALVKNSIDQEKTGYSNAFKGETPKLKQREFSQVDKLIAEEQAQFKKYAYDKLVEQLTRELVNALKYFSSDDSEISRAERMVWDIEEKYGARILGEVLQNIYVQYNDFPKMLMGICRAVGRFELNEVMPWGPTMLVGLLAHKNENVKEYAVSVVENWADVDLLPVLRNIDCSSLWLKAYIKDVVSYLEECYALRKKII